jgi:hypothetical protein
MRVRIKTHSSLKLVRDSPHDVMLPHDRHLPLLRSGLYGVQNDLLSANALLHGRQPSHPLRRPFLQHQVRPVIGVQTAIEDFCELTGASSNEAMGDGGEAQPEDEY